MPLGTVSLGAVSAGAARSALADLYLGRHLAHPILEVVAIPEWHARTLVGSRHLPPLSHVCGCASLARSLGTRAKILERPPSAPDPSARVLPVQRTATVELRGLPDERFAYWTPPIPRGTSTSFNPPASPDVRYIDDVASREMPSFRRETTSSGDQESMWSIPSWRRGLRGSERTIFHRPPRDHSQSTTGDVRRERATKAGDLAPNRGRPVALPRQRWRRHRPRRRGSRHRPGRGIEIKATSTPRVRQVAGLRRINPRSATVLRVRSCFTQAQTRRRWGIASGLFLAPAFAAVRHATREMS